MKIQDGCLVTILDYLSAWEYKLTCILPWYNSLPNLKLIIQTVLMILSRNENLRWLSGSHIGLPIGLKIQLDLYLTLIQLPTKFEIDRSNSSQYIKQKRKSKMATWWPYLITYQPEKPTELVSYLDTIAYQIWNLIVPTVLKILSWNENLRWPPGSHIGLPFGLNIQLDLYLTLIQLPTKFETDSSNGSQDIEGKWKSKMATSGHLVAILD